MEEARDIALVLRAGALPVELEFQEQRVVGAGLGSRRHRQAPARPRSWVVALVLLFILIYYKTSGFLATLTLSLNVIFVLACLVAFGATLTLPGIAGIALTVGMAVDANIIVYERIREEFFQTGGASQTGGELFQGGGKRLSKRLLDYYRRQYHHRIGGVYAV